MNITELLSLTGHGKALADANEKLRELCLDVSNTLKAGTLTLTVKVAPAERVDGALIITIDPKSKLPQADPEASLFFVDADGQLSREDPNQATLFHIEKLKASNE